MNLTLNSARNISLNMLLSSIVVSLDTEYAAKALALTAFALLGLSYMPNFLIVFSTTFAGNGM